jgi:hypothetical protein
MPDEADLFALEMLAYLPWVYWLKMLQAHTEFMEDMCP